MSNWYTRSTLIGIDVGNVVFQIICCYLITTIYRKSQLKKTQQLYLINLAAIEAFANTFLMVRDVVNLKRLHADNSTGACIYCTNIMGLSSVQSFFESYQGFFSFLSFFVVFSLWVIYPRLFLLKPRISN